MNSHSFNIYQTSIKLKLILNRNDAKSWEGLARCCDEGSKNLLLRVSAKQQALEIIKKNKK